MPLIHIRSLPFDTTVDIGAVLEGVSADFAQGTGIALEHVTATWDFFLPGHYAVAGQRAMHQPQDSHPILVELAAPDFHCAEDIEQMLTTLATGLASRVHMPLTNIFIQYRPAQSGKVFDAGEIVRW